ncbi:hypothetical protein K493DRAFT_241521 [Basidiobolus meristosporus CBS 931.73]|uniref:chitin synthase n=1 Tax=Basidiobolus meristosporus CBS 931.73 TaxID=1314790 RepID=A0A1Y1X7H8_9FUNG|nr:hypothetical protein K493DRAFT_241521 [Basidiobolus meristosporus CBS 931.73]|eukprot:ORX81719.1 hypothetical protein K493DRAFT_241521 [Basidiobolus meristosporus CBS 931.73]
MHKNAKPTTGKPAKKRPSCWVIFSWLVTFYAPSPLLACLGMKTSEIRQAWREKMALCSIILVMCGAVGFLTFAFEEVLCGLSRVQRVYIDDISPNEVVINGNTLNIGNTDLFRGDGGKDVSFLVQNVGGHCQGVIGGIADQGIYFPCVPRQINMAVGGDIDYNPADCYFRNSTDMETYSNLPLGGDVYYKWKDVKQRNLVVYNSQVLDFSLVHSLLPGIDVTPVFSKLSQPDSIYGGTDITYLMNNYHRDAAKCAMQIFRVGALDTTTMGCIISKIILYVSLVVILGVVLTKFFFAVYFGWVLSWRLGTFRQETYEERMKRMEAIEQWSESPTSLAIPASRSYIQQGTNSALPPTGRIPSNHSTDLQKRVKANHPYHSDGRASSNSLVPPNCRPISPNQDPSRRSSYSSSTLTSNIHIPPTPPPQSFQPFNFKLAYTMMLVTCYSEGAEGIRTTLDSLALTDYPQSHKLILVIADGIIVGSGNDMSTPDICLSMMKDFVIAPENVKPYSYVAIADGSKRHNMAKVYAGYYKFDDELVPIEKQQRVPMILISKCGTPQEANAAKPGNRGKRDSQIILMSFLQRVMFDDRMTELEYELFNAVWSTTGVSPDNFEIILMVDADTRVYPDSATRMISCMVRDPQIMGLCGETKIANKTDSWVTTIQVFEYYISHHLVKSFEAVFGSVTCLPGCFCMYRIKAPKGSSNTWVPVLASPDIVEHYSENVVDTLHKKNLLLLGEDRYLTTLMLKTFPKRKMMFVPQAVCKTVVPDAFSVLLSQRRRWINSTVHNLLELVLVRDLCGTFCFSMQFVIFMDLVSTTVLPASICFTVYLIVIAFIVHPPPIIPLTLLALILGSPAILILLTSRKLVYIAWMVIYLISLPIWNLVLPAYAFWHFDDFSWGQTRLVEGEVAGGGDHSKREGEFDGSQITMKRWSEFEREKRRKTSRALSEISSYGSSNTSIEKLGYHCPSQLARLSSANLSSAQSEAESESSTNSRGSKGTQ